MWHKKSIKRKKKILFSTSSLYKMRYDWLNELGKNAYIDIYYQEDDPGAHQEKWTDNGENCSLYLVPGTIFPVIGLVSFSLINRVMKHSNDYDIIILDGYGYVTQVLIMLFLNWKKRVYYVNIDGMVPNDYKHNISFLIKKHLLKRVPFFLCGSKAANLILAKYGVSEKAIINHPFSSLFRKDIFNDVSTYEEKKSIRQKYKIMEDFIVISVGRFSYLDGYGKGYDVLLKVAKQLPRSIGWYIVGDNPTEEFVELTKAYRLDNLHYVNYLEKETLKEYYRAADVFVLMTISDVWGLVINEALACGLPVITTNMCMAGVDLIKNGYNGYLVQVGDCVALANHVCNLKSNSEGLKLLAKNALSSISEYTIENMVRIHMDAFNISTI